MHMFIWYHTVRTADINVAILTARQDWTRQGNSVQMLHLVTQKIYATLLFKPAVENCIGTQHKSRVYTRTMSKCVLSLMLVHHNFLVMGSAQALV